MSDEPIAEEEVQDSPEEFKWSKAAGPDGIHPEIVKAIFTF